jgi:hypothetical protein
MQNNEVLRLKSSCKLYMNMLKGIKKYGQMHSKYSSDMKMTMILDKLTLMLIAGNQIMQTELTNQVEQVEKNGPLPDDMVMTVETLSKEIDNVFDSLTGDITFLMDKIGNIDNLYERVDQKLDMILSSPDYVPGQKMMNNAKKHFESTPQ